MNGNNQFTGSGFPTQGGMNMPYTGSNILYNDGNKLIMNQGSSPNGLLMSQGGVGASSPVPIVFPPADPNWFNSGYPQLVSAGESDGNLIEYVPVSFYARKTGHCIIGLGGIQIYKGFIDSNGNYVTEIQVDGNYKQGDFVFAILLDKWAGASNGTKIRDKSYWTLLSEVSNIQPGQTVEKSVSVTSGITTQESKTFSTTVGSTVGFKAGFSGSEINASLSVSLSSSFSSSVSVSEQITVQDKVTFPAQEKVQRIAIYQFLEDYEIIPGGPLKGWRDYLNGTSTDEAKFFSNQFVCSVEQPPKFTYPSRYFATSFVLQP